jgi:HSP20 family protein
MSKDLIRIMHALFLPAGGCHDTPWCPAADVLRTRDGWIVKFELAGVRAEDLELEALGRRLTLRGQRRDCTALEECRYYQMEIAYSHFERSLELPCNLERAQITTEFRDGMLLVRIADGDAS